MGFGTALVPRRGCTFYDPEKREPVFPDKRLRLSKDHAQQGAQLKVARCDQPRSLRGLYGCPSRHFCINASSSASFPSGSTIRVVTNRSPVAPAAFGSPLPLRRKMRPLEVFFGIDNSTALPNVGTRILPPSTASYSVIGRSTRRSLPSTLKKACGAMLTVIRRSPGR